MPGSEEVQITVEKSAGEIFDQFDTDNSGQIDKSELANALGAAGVKTTPAQIEKLMGVIDTDGDGMISKPEFRAFVGASQALTMEQVTKKMERSMLETLVEASSGPDAAAEIAIQQQLETIQRLQQSGNSNGGLGAAQCKVLCIVLVLYSFLAGIIGLYVYGIIVGSEYQDKGDDLCQEGAVWILVLSIYSISQIVVCAIAKKMVRYKHGDARIAAVSKEGKQLQQLQQLCNLFAFCWLCYGINLFMTQNDAMRKSCAETMWNYGYLYTLISVIIMGTVFGCLILALCAQLLKK